jgi:hypothetical protein
MARLYANENFPYPVVEELRRLGHDVLTIHETRKADQAMPDDAVLAFARETGRAVLTLNRRHFIRLHQTDPHHHGMIACTFDADFAALAARVDAAARHRTSLAGELIRVNRPPR